MGKYTIVGVKHSSIFSINLLIIFVAKPFFDFLCQSLDYVSRLVAQVKKHCIQEGDKQRSFHNECWKGRLERGNSDNDAMCAHWRNLSNYGDQPVCDAEKQIAPPGAGAPDGSAPPPLPPLPSVLPPLAPVHQQLSFNSVEHFSSFLISLYAEPNMLWVGNDWMIPDA